MISQDRKQDIKYFIIYLVFVPFTEIFLACTGQGHVGPCLGILLLKNSNPHLPLDEAITEPEPIATCLIHRGRVF